MNPFMLSLKRLSLVVIIITALMLTLQQIALAAGTAEIYLSPSNQTVRVGELISVDVRVKSASDQVTAAEVYGNYDSQKLELVTVDGVGSNFNYSVDELGGDGNFESTRVALNNLSGDNSFTRLFFRALQAGDAEVSLDSQTQVSDPDGELVDVTLKSASVNVVEANSDSDTSAVGAGNAVSSSVEYVGYSIANIFITTSNPSEVSVAYGEAADQLDYVATAGGNDKTSHTVILDDTVLEPANTYYFRVDATDESGRRTSTSVSSFTTNGLSVELVIVDQNDNPVKTTFSVEGSDNDYQTDENGRVVLTGLASGIAELSIDRGWLRTTQETIVVSSDSIVSLPSLVEGRTIIVQSAANQEVTLQLSDSSPFNGVLGNILLALLILGGIALVVIPLRVFMPQWLRLSNRSQSSAGSTESVEQEGKK